MTYEIVEQKIIEYWQRHARESPDQLLEWLLVHKQAKPGIIVNNKTAKGMSRMRLPFTYVPMAGDNVYVTWNEELANMLRGDGTPTIYNFDAQTYLGYPRCCASAWKLRQGISNKHEYNLNKASQVHEMLTVVRACQGPNPKSLLVRMRDVRVVIRYKPCRPTCRSSEQLAKRYYDTLKKYTLITSWIFPPLCEQWKKECILVLNNIMKKKGFLNKDGLYEITKQMWESKNPIVDFGIDKKWMEENSMVEVVGKTEKAARDIRKATQLIQEVSCSF